VGLRTWGTSQPAEGMTLDAWRRRGNAFGSRPSLLGRMWRRIAG
jgi:hypothetical protein